MNRKRLGNVFILLFFGVILIALGLVGKYNLTGHVIDSNTVVYQQGANDYVSMETENMDAGVNKSDHNWSKSVGSYSNGLAMTTSPNGAGGVNGSVTSTSPELDYYINFNKTGTYYVWVRGKGGGNDDSVYAGLDGSVSSTFLGTSGTSLVWSKTDYNYINVTVNVASAGFHTFTLWMREDGTIVDKILLTTNASYVPSGNGPNPSTRSTTTTNPPADNSCTSFTYSSWSTCTNGQQSRTVTSSTPSGCSGGVAPGPLTQSCTTNNPNPPAACTDSDNGLNYFVAGVTNSTNGDFEDYCTDNVLSEYRCLNDLVNSTTYTCTGDYVCNEGRCVIDSIENDTPTDENLPEIDFNLYVCEEVGCTDLKENFLVNSTTYISASSSLTGLDVHASLTYPTGILAEIPLPYTVLLNETGEYLIFISASKDGYNDLNTYYSFYSWGEEEYTFNDSSYECSGENCTLTPTCEGSDCNDQQTSTDTSSTQEQSSGQSSSTIKAITSKTTNNYFLTAGIIVIIVAIGLLIYYIFKKEHIGGGLLIQE